MEYFNHEKNEESFIIQNITPNYHFVSDIGLSFKPLEVLDLTWEDPNLIKKSSNLRDSLRRGHLKKLTTEEYERTLKIQYEKEKKELIREQERNQKKYQKVKTDDRDFEADIFDPMKASKKNQEVDITGTANHPMSYVAAFEIAQTIAAERGDLISAEEFASLVEQNPNIVPGLLAKTRQAQTEVKTHTSYYAVPMGDGATQTGVVKADNFNKASKAVIGIDYDELAEKANYIIDSIDFETVEATSNRDDLDLDSPYDDANEDSDFTETINLDDEK